MRRRTMLIALVSLVVTIALGAFAYIAVPRAEYAPYQYGSAPRQQLPRMTLLNHDEIMHDVVGHPLLPVETIGILVYEGASTLEAVGAMVVFSELMDVNVKYIAPQAGIISTDLAEIVVEHTIHEIDELDVLVVPGGTQTGLANVLSDKTLHDWIQQIDQETTLTAGIGYGSVLLSEAGLLREKEIAFGWPNAEANALALGAHLSPERYVRDGKYWTSVGGTAVIDMSLAMVQTIAGRAHLQGAMLDLEYDPAPPFEGGTEESTPTNILDTLLATSYEYQSLTLLDSSSIEQATAKDTLHIGIMVYDGFFTLDAIGPLAVLSQLEEARVELIRVGDDEQIQSGRTHLIVPQSIADVTTLDLLLVPGGADGTWDMTQNTEVLDWIRLIDGNSRYTTSVCTGSWVLGAAGLLENRRATTNWYRASQMMERYGAQFEAARYTSDGKYWTSAGVSAGIDMSFALLEALHDKPTAQAAMMRLHYDPHPPIDAGTPEKTDDLVLDMMHQMYDYIMVPLLRKGH